MLDSPGKRASRAYFYQECLPTLLTREQLRASNILLLLGPEPAEIPYLDELGVARDAIWSVENDYATFVQQQDMRLGISLYHGDMADYLRYLLHANQSFGILALDVEGSYLHQLDPSMTSVMLYCWRNPTTVVATTASIGRDRSTLWEGVLSLLVLLWYAPEATEALVRRLTRAYTTAGFTPMGMVLRDLFWIRSVFEHTLAASGSVGVCPALSVRIRQMLTRTLWKRLQLAGTVPLSLQDLRDHVEGTRQEQEHIEALRTEPLRLGVRISTLHHLVYNAVPPWSQLCHFVRFERTEERTSCERWLQEACERFRAPLIHINRDGVRRDIRLSTVARDLPLILGHEDREFYAHFDPRPAPSPSGDGVITTEQTLRALRPESVHTTRTSKGVTHDTKGSHGQRRRPHRRRR